jgi:hypothetical protein
MRYPTDPIDGQLKGIRQTIEEALGKLENATDEVAEKTIRDLFPSSAGARGLIPFTGYYGIDTAAGAFFSIDTTEIYFKWPRTQEGTLLTLSKITVNVSLDGKVSTSYPFDSSTSFDGQTLIIPNVLQVSLTRGYQGGQLVLLSGTIAGQSVLGSTYFNPVALPVFAGTYIGVKGILIGKTRLALAADSSLSFDSGRGLQNISIFTYDPAMYVLNFESDGVLYTLMLGTSAQAGQLGLVCFITDGTSNEVAVTIP